MENRISQPICFFCKHFHKKKYELKDDYECDAFNSIPQEILIGENDHSKPLSDQENNIVFESKEIKE